MARRQTSREVEVDLAFPLEGLDEQRAYMRQRPGTAVAAQNVQAFEPGTNRARGGMRSGFTPYFPITDSVSVAAKPIQCIDHLVTNDAKTVITSLDQSIFAKTSGNAYGLADISGSTSWSAAATASAAFACSCWDTLGNVYAAEVNTTTGAVKVTSYTTAGVLRWSLTGAFTVATGSLRSFAGMVVIGSSLYVAVNSGSSVYSIHKLNTASGAATLSWATNAVTGFTNLIYSTGACNCLGAIGTLLGVECFGAASNKQGFMVIDTTVSPVLSTPLYLLYGGTASAQRSTVCSDGLGTFYTIASVSAGQVKAVSASGILVWTSTVADSSPQGLAFDPSTAVLAAACTTTSSVRSIKLSDGTADATAAHTGNPGSVSSWNWIDSDANGHFTVWRNANASNDVMSFLSSNTASTVWGPSTFANTTHNGASVNRGVTQFFPSGSSRQIRGLLVTGGQCKRFDTTGTFSITGGQSFSINAPVIFSAQLGTNMFFADGVSYFYYKSLTDAITAWTPTTGTMPVDAINSRARLIAMWRGRIVLAGLVRDPNNWFMSAQNSPFDWNYSPATPSQTQAVAGTTSDTGLVGDFINTIIPYSDDTLIFGCNSSIWQLTGDPAAGGQLDAISHRLGMAWGRPWAIDLFGQIYFFGSRSGIFKMTPGALPVRISQAIERRLEAVDYSANIIRMAWDIPLQGLRVWITPLDPTQTTTNYLWEERTNAWWPVIHANTMHNPLSVHVFDGDVSTDRVTMIGGRDGRIHSISSTNAIDDATAISSFVWLGPIMTKDLDQVLLKDMQATLGVGSATVNYQVYVGRSPEAALASTPVWSGTWKAGRNPVSFIRRSGIAIFIKISCSSAWALEKIRARYEPMGKVFRRMP